MIAIISLRTRIPAPGTRATVDMYRTVVHELTKQDLNLTSRVRRKNLTEFLHPGARGRIVLYVLQKQSLVRLAVEPPFPRVHPGLPR